MSTTVHRIAGAVRVRPDAILPQHPAYDDARLAWNLAVDQRPAAIVVARTTADVVGAVALAAERGLRVAAQGTGHLASALPDLENAILVKTAIGGVEVDPVARVARVGAGAVWRDVVDAVHPYGLAALSGSSHDVGVLGYTLGGGASWLARAKGLSANNVRAIELVTADARLVRVDADHEPELFWALRGGGGNFGVVTHIELQLFPIAEVFAGMTVWPASAARELLTAWAAWATDAPDEVTTSFRLLRLPDLPDVPEPLRDVPVVVVDGAVLAEPARAAELLAGFRAVGEPLLDTWATIPPKRLIEIHMDPPAPVPADADTTLVGELDEAGLDAFLTAVDPDVVAPLLFAELRQLGGALGRVPEGAGARGRFEGAFTVFAVGVPEGPEHADLLAARIDAVVDAMRPWSTGTAYLNFSDRGGSAEHGYGPGVYERLQAVRRVWDPQERFVGSHRIATS
ncbi:FAD-binding oxidoreductase [Conexibacter stalactiti]|uniref:FAD-binding oxidoreductase n=1 Tax=Conexibacter stalactiti TaxID=1940611 RepID=A0ABU4HR91_9ACTN|nr:FAD-binding oxidoreductase [Conexibacter stalactiti]MDW5595274.1 FAD-binding oxidoreductase [Conexibacter stalactiti]MEC5035916.1 FAD-binding oxidoreductase [Conexibacter stalactiti]